MAMFLRKLLEQTVRKGTRCLSHPKKRKFSSSLICLVAPLTGKVDRYNGIIVDLSELPEVTSASEFGAVLADSLEKWRNENRTAVWLQVPIHFSRHIAVAARYGFQFHNAEHDQCLLKLWLPDRVPDTTPRFATHQLGVCGVVLREDTKELLVVQERRSQFTLWKFPGGLADLGENIGDAAVREVFEETGIKAEFASVIAMRQQHTHPGAFGRSDLYVICRLRALTLEISPCDHEIAQCMWMSVDELRHQLQISSLTYRLTSLITYGLKHGFDEIDFHMEQLESLYKGVIRRSSANGTVNFTIKPNNTKRSNIVSAPNYMYDRPTSLTRDFSDSMEKALKNEFSSPLQNAKSATQIATAKKAEATQDNLDPYVFDVNAQCLCNGH